MLAPLRGCTGCSLRSPGAYGGYAAVAAGAAARALSRDKLTHLSTSLALKDPSGHGVRETPKSAIHDECSGTDGRFE
jgi:hypothetical protein